MADQNITATETRFTTDGATASGYLARPAQITSAPALILIQEWWGLNDHIKDIARRYAGEGFITVAVDLYDGTVTKDAAEAGKLMVSLDPAQALQYLQTTINYLRSLPEVTSVGVTGFCMGGVYTILAACHNPVDAAISFYGVPDDLSVLANLSCPLLAIGGEKDQWITIAKMERLSETLKQYGKDGEVKIYAGAEHAFFNDTRAEVYSPADAQDAWQRALGFFRQHLK